MKNRKTAFFDSHGNPKLRKSYCVVMDIIGFKEMIEEAQTNAESEAILNRLHKVISNQLNRLNQYVPDDDDYTIDWHIKIFTDNIVLGQMIQSTEAEYEWSYVIIPISEFQLALALEGFFLKGGISLGKLFIDDIIVYGPALLEAYRIEQSIARDSRIVLSNDVLKLMEKHVSYWGKPEISPQYREILIDSDGNAFIHYLSLLVDYAEEIESFSDLWTHLEEHRLNIEHGLTKYRTNPDIWSKYYWLANYHNYFCGEVKNIPGYNRKYRINSKLLSRKILKISQTDSSS